jgi:hypothetical protein
MITLPRYVRRRDTWAHTLPLTNKEGNNATRKIYQAFEKVDDQVDDLVRELCRKFPSVLDKVYRGGEEGPDELDKRRDEVGQGVDDGRHGE